MMKEKVRVKLNCKHGGEWFVAEADESVTYCEKCGCEVPATMEPVKEDEEDGDS